MRRKWLTRAMSFLVACIVSVTALSCGLGLVSASDDEHDLTQYITGVTLWIDGNLYDPDTSAGVTSSSELSFKVDFAEVNKDLSEGGLQFPEDGILTYTIPADLNVLNIKAESGVLKNNKEDEFGDEVGTYTIDESGKVTIQFKEGYTNSYPNIEANFYFTATISDEFENTNETGINFSDDVSIDIKFDHSSGLDVSKKIVGYDKETKTVTYEIVAENSRGTVRDVVITDTMEANLILVGDVSEAFEIETNPEKGNEPNVSVSKSDDTGWDVYPYNKYLISIDEMGPGSSVTLIYKATVSEDAFKNADSNGNLQWVNNSVSATATDIGNNDQTVTVYEKNVYFNEETYFWNSKSGELSDDQKSAIWTFMVNKSAGFSVDGNTATDTLKSSELSYDKTTPIVLNKYDANGELVSTSDIQWNDANLTVTDTSFSYTFPEGSGAYAYEFVYKTDIDISNILGSETLSNEGGYTGGGQGVSYEIDVDGNIDASINKEVTASGDNWNTLGWKITAVVKNNNTDLKYYIEDTLENSWTASGLASDTLDVESFKVTINENSAVNGTDYTLVYDETNNTFGVYFNSENKDSSYLKASDEEYIIVIEYNTIVNEAFKTDNQYLINNAKAVVGGDKEFYTSATAKITNSEVNVHKTVISQSDTGLKAEYEININNWADGDTTEANKQLNTAPLVIDDVFDTEKFELDTDSPVVIMHGDYYWSDWSLETTDNVTISYEPLDVDGETVGVRFTTSDIPEEYSNRIFVIRYTLKLKDEYINDETVSMPNTATVKQGSLTLGSDEVTCEYKPNFLSKSYTSQAGESNGYRGTFTLDVNKLKADISDDDLIVVKDKLDSSMTLDLDSIQVLGENGSEVNHTISYDADTKLLSVTVPDETYVTIVYDVVFRGTSGTTQSFTNSAWIEGLDSSKIDVNDNVQFASQDSGGSAGGSIPTFSILKYDESDTTKKLEGAVFGLYKTNGTLVMTQMTGENGVAEFESADFTDGDYYLQEITAPDGYALDPTKHYFSLNCDSENGYRKVFYQDTINITNRKTQFTVNKVDEDGNGVSDAILEIVNSEGETVYTYKTDGEPITVGNLSNGTYTLKETKAPDGYEIADAIEFELVDGKLVSGSGIDVDSQTITMVDKTEETTEETSEETTEATTEETTEATTEETTEAPTEVKYNPSLKKIVNGTETDAEFTFVVAPSDNKLDSAAAITLKNGETKEIEGLVDGTEYVIYEVGADGYDIAFENGESEYVFTYDSSAEGLVFTATNTEYKGIKLKKTVAENGIVQIADESVTFDFEIVDASGNVIKSVTVSQGEEISIDGKGFKDGSEYTLVETTVSKYELTVKVNGEEAANNSFVYSKDSVVEVEAVNAYTEPETESTTEETTEETSEETTEATTEETTEATTEETTEATTEETTEATTEETTEATTEETTEATTEETTEATTEETTEATTEETTEATTEVKYNPSLKKIVKGTETDAEFAFVVAPSDNKLESAATITLKNGETKEIEGLVDGTEYVIYEVGADGYDIAFENGESEYVFTYDSSAEGLVFTATNTEYKGIKLKKTVAENGIVQIADESVTFDFEIVDASENVIKSVMVSQGEEISIDGKGFKDGSEYTLVETTVSKYELTVKVNGEEAANNSFAYSKDSVVEVEAVNAYTEPETESTTEETTEETSEETTEATTEETTEATTEEPTEATTEETTEATTEETTEATTEEPTEATTEETTEATTEETTEATTEETTEAMTEETTEATTEETTEATTEETTEATTEEPTEATTEETTETTTVVTTVELTTGSQTESTTESYRDKLIRYLNENLNENDYTPESWKVYEEVLERAKLVLAAGDENEIKAILEELEEARRKLVLGASVNTGVVAEVSLGVFALVGIVGTAAIFKRKRDDE